MMVVSTHSYCRILAMPCCSDCFSAATGSCPPPPAAWAGGCCACRAAPIPSVAAAMTAPKTCFHVMVITSSVCSPCPPSPSNDLRPRRHADRQRLRVGDLHTVPHLHAFEVLLVLYLEAGDAPVIHLDRDRRHLHVNGRHGHRRRHLPRHRPPGLRALAPDDAGLLARRHRRRAGLLDLVDHRLVVPEGDLVTHLQLI